MYHFKIFIFSSLILFILLFSIYPTIFELQQKDKLKDTLREFILEHNYYWPDYNLYLSKIRQGLEGRLTAVEKYTSEIHQGSLIQGFYVALGWLGKVLNLDPNSSYLLGRIILAPLLLLVILQLVKYYFPSNNSSPPLKVRGGRGALWQILAFLITVTSASIPRIYQDAQGITHIGRFMEWWSNIDALQRITFIPHILFGQIVSFFLLYQLTMKPALSASRQISQIRPIRLTIFIILGNAVGLTFPPSLITLNSVLLLMILIKFSIRVPSGRFQFSINFHSLNFQIKNYKFNENFKLQISNLLYILLTLPSLLYIFLITKITPWSALIQFHRTHPMMIPFDQYILGTGPIFFLGFAGAVLSIINRDRKFQPLIFWVLATFGFAAFFSAIKDQSPLRFTQTGLFIPLGILGAYLFYQVFHLSDLSYLGYLGRSQMKAAFILVIAAYLLGNLFMMKTSLSWQTDWITQRINAFNPDVPYPPQAMYPLREWMDGIRWLKNNTNGNDVVLAEITAANHIPAYSGNFVYWGQSNTVDFNRKELEVDKFFRGQMSANEAQIFLRNGRIKYIFFSIQEKEKLGKNLQSVYPFIKSVYFNPITTIYTVN